MRITKLFFFLIVMIAFFFTSVSYAFGSGDKLTEEQMTAYRTQPAVALIYSGMFVKFTLQGGQPQELPNYGSGSGFFINPDGYLVTNGHVVDSYNQYMNDKEGNAAKVLDETITEQIKENFKKANGRDPNEQELKQAVDKFKQEQQPKIVDHGPINYVILSNSETLRFELKKFSPSIPNGGKDIAVLKIERDNCPVIMLGDSSKLVLQEPVFTIGFPGAVDPQRFPLLGKENTLKASITRGAISALKTDYKGMSVIQHDCATSPGNSGGPTVDTQGRVIGVHSYAATMADGFKFCIPINSAKEFIQDAGVEYNKSSDFTNVFNKLMDSVWEERWFDAQSQVNASLTYMDNEPNLKRLSQMIQKKIDDMGFFGKMWQQNKIVVIIAIVLVLLIIVVLWFSLSPSSAKDAAHQAAPPVAEVPQPAADHTKIAQDDGTMLEGDISGTITVMIKGEEIGTYNVTTNPLIVGRDPKTASVHIDSEIVSKNHLRILPKGDQFFIVDLGSTNGTFVNGQKITETLVKPDDIVQLGKRGDIKIKFKK